MRQRSALPTPGAYQLEGSLLEVCTCNILCPCWVGEDPDGGKCDGVLSWHFEKGTVNGTDVSGRTFTILTHIPGNILAGNWKIVVYIDDGASDEQQQALLDVWTGKLGGPVADLAQLVGEVLAVERAPTTFEVEGVKGTLKIGSAIHAELEPFNPTHFVALGHFFRLHGLHAKSKREYEKALSLVPTHAEAMASLKELEKEKR